MKNYKLLIFFLVCFVYILGYFFWPFKVLDERIFDKFLSPIEAHPSIVVVEIDEESLDELGQWPWNREIYAQFLNSVTSTKPAVVAFDIYLSESVEGEDGVLRDALQNVDKTIDVVWAAKLEEGELLLPIPEVSTHSDVGYGNVDTDSTGQIRYYQLFTGQYDSLANVVLDNYFKGQLETEIKKIERIHYLENYEDFDSVSFLDVLNQNTDVDLTDKIVLIGVTVEDVKNDVSDNFIASNTGKYIPGVYIHANMINTILQNEQVKEMPLIAQIILGIILQSLIFVLAGKLKTWRKVFILILIPLFFTLMLIILQYNFMTPIIFPIVMGTALWLILFILDYILQYRESLKVKKAFSQYVGTHILDKLTDSGDELLKPGGVENDVLVMFSDIIGFTSISEKLKPEELITLINSYLTDVTRVIISNDGVIDKYIGDNVMAFWGAPVEDNKMCTKACKAILEMQKAIADFNDNFMKKLIKESKGDLAEVKLVSGIGLHFGRVIVGNLGSQQKFDYTVMGDNVNLASRIEGLTRKYKCKNLVSESVIERLKCEGLASEFVYRFVDEVIVKGRHNSIKIFEIVGFQDSQDYIENKKFVQDFEKAVDLYRGKNFAEAKKLFVELEKHGDGTSGVYLERIKQLRDDASASKSFNGVWKWEEK